MTGVMVSSSEGPRMTLGLCGRADCDPYANARCGCHSMALMVVVNGSSAGRSTLSLRSHEGQLSCMGQFLAICYCCRPFL